MKGDPKIPSLAAVNAAWVTARPGRPEAPATADEPRTDPFRARPFCQGVVLEHLRQERERGAGSKLYRASTRLDAPRAPRAQAHPAVAGVWGLAVNTPPKCARIRFLSDGVKGPSGAVRLVAPEVAAALHGDG